MRRRDRRFIRTVLVALVLAVAMGVTPAASGSARDSTVRAHGCHAWPPVFRPVLAILAAGKIRVALPAHVPRFNRRLYAHANVLQPPLTYDVVLSTRAGLGWPVPRRTVLLAVHGSAGVGHPPRGSTAVAVAGKALDLEPGSSRTRSAVWRDRAGNITYRVAVPARLGVPALLRVAGSLTPGVLRRTPITDGTPIPFNACP